jgi:DNA polymerase zeta
MNNILDYRPITLKLEKVYHGCVMVSKKRYAGNKFENEIQTKGELDCKGIEIVRRDSCGVVQHALESSLRLLFDTNEIYNVKQFLLWYWMQMLSDKLLLRDFIFAKEVRMGTYSERRW